MLRITDPVFAMLYRLGAIPERYFKSIIDRYVETAFEYDPTFEEEELNVIWLLIKVDILSHAMSADNYNRRIYEKELFKQVDNHADYFRSLAVKEPEETLAS